MQTTIDHSAAKPTDWQPDSNQPYFANTSVGRHKLNQLPSDAGCAQFCHSTATLLATEGVLNQAANCTAHGKTA